MKNPSRLPGQKVSILVCALIYLSICGKSQTAGPFRKYAIKISQSAVFDVDSEKVFIKRICAATSVNYNAYTHYFEVLTSKNLNRNVVEGKLFKHATPMEDYLFNGIETNTGTLPVLQPHQ